MLAHVPGVENPTADYLFCPKIQPQNRIYSKLTDSFTAFHVKIGLASKNLSKRNGKQTITLTTRLMKTSEEISRAKRETNGQAKKSKSTSHRQRPNSTG